jgi:hypothetical protein
MLVDRVDRESWLSAGFEKETLPGLKIRQAPGLANDFNMHPENSIFLYRIAMLTRRHALREIGTKHPFLPAIHRATDSARKPLELRPNVVHVVQSLQPVGDDLTKAL